MAQFSEIRRRCVSGGVPRRSLIVAIFVGTILNLINQGDVLLAGAHITLWKVVLTFIVPYCVATYGAVSVQTGEDPADPANEVQASRI